MVIAALTACADKMPVPGGSSEVNRKCFGSIAEMQARLLEMHIGQAEGEILTKLCANRESLRRLERGEIRTALLGGPSVLFAQDNGETDAEVIQNLYGYSMTYKQVKSVHGFTSPIRIRTDEKGFHYTITLIFRNGMLFEKPLLTGGMVNDRKSSTLFDFLTPGTFISAVGP